MSEAINSQQPALTVSQLNRRARQLLETHFPLLWVEGEISNLARPSSGHIYFTLKDEHAQVRSAMFRNRSANLGFRPQNGDHVIVRCRVGLYEERGEYQLIIEHMEQAGFGALQRRFEELKAKLSQEGLFDEIHKKPLPHYPNRLGIITSASGAALHDVLTVLARRYPALAISVYPVAVQGAEAPSQIVQALAQANHPHPKTGKPHCDLLLLTRGGGSLEDLWAFNEEKVARAIYQSNLPIVSAVGHEVDFTIADFVADLRAPTPSAAAELISQDQQELSAQLAGYDYYFSRQVKNRLQQNHQLLLALRKRLRHPREKLEAQGQKLDHLELRLARLMQRHLSDHSVKLGNLSSRLNVQHPSQLLDHQKNKLEQTQQRFFDAWYFSIKEKRRRLQKAAELLQAVSPLATLERGYAIVTDSHKQLINQTARVNPGQRITTRIRDGALHCEVLETESINDP